MKQWTVDNGQWTVSSKKILKTLVFGISLPISLHPQVQSLKT
ncbi:MAG: hypothetical protein R3Y46_06035 [Opitutales bacterium]